MKKFFLILVYSLFFFSFKFQCKNNGKQLQTVQELQDAVQSLNVQLDDLREQNKNLINELGITKKALEENDETSAKQREELESRLTVKQSELDMITNELNEQKEKVMTLEQSSISAKERYHNYFIDLYSQMSS